MKNLKSLKWELGLAGMLGVVILLNGIKASPSFDQAVFTASSQTQSNTDSFNSNEGSLNSSNFSNSQFNDSNSNSANSFNQAPSTPSQGAVSPHTRSRRS